MRPLTATTISPWARGRFKGGLRPRARLLFGTMWEDPAIERSVFPPGSRVFAIASAGCTSMALAANGCHVTAVDINPAQIAHVHDRIATGAMQRGAADRIIAIARSTLPLSGISRAARARFANLDDPVEQQRMWREDTGWRRWRALLGAVPARRLLSVVYRGAFLDSLPKNFGDVLLRRIERTIARHPNRINPFVRRLLRGDNPPVDALAARATAERLRLFASDAALFLESCPPNTFDGLTFSNILDGASPEYTARLWSATTRAARVGAPVVLRSFREPRTKRDAELAARDRSIFWGTVLIERISRARGNRINPFTSLITATQTERPACVTA